MITETTYRYISDWVNPFLFGIWICVLAHRMTPKPQGRFVVLSVLATLISAVAAEQGKIHRILLGSSTFPSGHEAFCACIATSLSVAERRWIWVGLTCGVLLGWALTAAGFHRAIDVFGGAGLGASVTLAVLRIGMPRIKPADQ